MMSIRSITWIAASLCMNVTLSALAQSVPLVSVSPLSELALYPERKAPAMVISLNQPVISSQIAATVIDIPVRVGDIVKNGQTLAKLDCADYKLAQQMADGNTKGLNARIVLAKRRVARAVDLESRNLLSTDDLQGRQTDLAALRADQVSARASLEQARLNTSRCVISSPFKAVVTERLTEVGQFTNTGSALVKLVDLDQLEVSAQVLALDASYLQSVKSLQLVHDEQRYALKLRQVLAVIDPSSRNREVRLDFVQDRALPGASGQLIWREPRPHLAAEFWLKRNGQVGVFVLQNARAHFVAVPQAKMGRANVLTIPLKTPIITKGYQSLSDQQHVNIEQ